MRPGRVTFTTIMNIKYMSIQFTLNECIYIFAFLLKNLFSLESRDNGW